MLYEVLARPSHLPTNCRTRLTGELSDLVCLYRKQHREQGGTGMANPEQVERLKQGVAGWNVWRGEHPEIQPDLNKAELSGANLSGANLSYVNLFGANLSQADLSGTTLMNTNLTGTTLTGCAISGISAGNLQLEGAKQDHLIITPDYDPAVTVDGLEVARFLSRLLTHQELLNGLHVVTERGVLLLGRFGDGGQEVLQAVAARLPQTKHLPTLFHLVHPHTTTP